MRFKLSFKRWFLWEKDQCENALWKSSKCVDGDDKELSPHRRRRHFCDGFSAFRDSAVITNAVGMALMMMLSLSEALMALELT